MGKIFRQLIMNAYIFASLPTCSKRAIRNVKKRWGHYKHYTPSQAICESVATKHNISVNEARIELEKIRAFFLNEARYNR